MNRKQKIAAAAAALNRLENELDQPGGFNEYANHCEDLLVRILPYLNEEGLEIVESETLNCCRLAK